MFYGIDPDPFIFDAGSAGGFHNMVHIGRNDDIGIQIGPLEFDIRNFQVQDENSVHFIACMKTGP
jgi:hypothetical protein